HESALVLLKVELEAPDKLSRPVIRPALLIVMTPVPAVVASMARSLATPPTDLTIPAALVLIVMLPADVLPTAAERTVITPLVAEPMPRTVALMLMVVGPVVLAVRMPAPRLLFDVTLPLAVTTKVPLPD